MVLKNWHESDKVEGEQALMEYSLNTLMYRMENALDEFLQNLPNTVVAKTLRVLTMPLARRWDKPHDDLTRTIALSCSTDSAIRNKMLSGLWITPGTDTVDNPIARYNDLLKDYEKAEELYCRVNKAYNKGDIPMEALHPEQRFSEALKAKIFSEGEAEFMMKYEANVLEMLTVDDFAFDAFAMDKSTVINHNA